MRQVEKKVGSQFQYLLRIGSKKSEFPVVFRVTRPIPDTHPGPSVGIHKQAISTLLISVDISLWDDNKRDPLRYLFKKMGSTIKLKTYPLVYKVIIGLFTSLKIKFKKDFSVFKGDSPKTPSISSKNSK